MSPELKRRSTLGYSIYSLLGTFLELSILLVVVLWALPKLGIHIAPAGIVILVVLIIGFSYYTYHMGKKALTKKLILELESMIGCRGTVITPIDPVGFVRIGNELWKAVSNSRISSGNEVIITGIEGLKITVSLPLCNTEHSQVKNNNS